MKEIKLYLKLFYEMNYKFVGLYLAIAAFVGLVAVGMQIFIIKPDEEYIADFQMLFPMLLCIFFVGIAYIYKQFEVAIRIRADRKNCLIALGITATLSSIAFGVGHFLVCNFVQYMSFKIAGLPVPGTVLNMSIYQTIVVNFVCIMGGMLVGALYNRLSIEKFIPLMIVFSIVLIVIPGFIINQETSLLETTFIWLWERPTIMMLGGLIGYLLTYLLLRKTSFKDYNNFPNYKLQLGKIRIGRL